VLESTARLEIYTTLEGVIREGESPLPNSPKALSSLARRLGGRE